MRIGAGLTAILIGIYSLFYVGLFGGMLGSTVGWLASVGPHTGADQTIRNWGDSVYVLSIASPLLAIIGGIITFGIPQLGALIIGASAFAHWSLLGAGFVGQFFVYPLGAAAILALISPPRRKAHPIVIAPPAAPPQSDAFDRTKWNALLEYDKDLSAAAARIRPFGDKWLDEFAAAFLALNDKQYLSEIVDRILSRAEVERDKASERAEAEKRDRERLEQLRRERRALWRQRLWGSTPRKIATAATPLCVLGIAAVLAWPKKYADPFAYCKAVGDRDLACVECGDDSPVGDTRYVGPSVPRVITSTLRRKLDMPSDEFPAVWRCMNGNIWGCYLGASGRACTRPDTSVDQRAIAQFCVQNPNSNVPNAVNNTPWQWTCNGSTAVIDRRYPAVQLDKRGYMATGWYLVDTAMEDSATERGQPPQGSSEKVKTTEAEDQNVAEARRAQYERDMEQAREEAKRYQPEVYEAIAQQKQPNYAGHTDDLCTILDKARNSRAELDRQIANERNPLKQDSLRQQIGQFDQQQEASLENFVKANRRQFMGLSGVISSLGTTSYTIGPGVLLGITLPCQLTVSFQFVEVTNPAWGSFDPESQSPLSQWRTALENVAVGDSVTFSGRFVKGVSTAVLTALQKSGGVAYKVPDAYLPATEDAAAMVSQGGLAWIPVKVVNTWPAAQEYCAGLNHDGQTGWRMPTRAELESLYNSKAMKVQGWGLGDTWSSSQGIAGPGWYWHVNLENGSVYNSDMSAKQGVSCVRSLSQDAAVPASAATLTPEFAEIDEKRSFGGVTFGVPVSEMAGLEPLPGCDPEQCYAKADENADMNGVKLEKVWYHFSHGKLVSVQLIPAKGQGDALLADLTKRFGPGARNNDGRVDWNGRRVFAVYSAAGDWPSLFVGDKELRQEEEGPAKKQAESRSAASTESLERVASARVRDYWAAWSLPNSEALTRIEGFYGSTIKFYGKAEPRGEVMKEKRKFAERWPARTYVTRDGSLAIRCGGTTCDVTGVVDWKAASGPRSANASGAANFSFTFVASGDSAKIASESGSVIK